MTKLRTIPGVLLSFLSLGNLSGSAQDADLPERIRQTWLEGDLAAAERLASSEMPEVAGIDRSRALLSHGWLRAAAGDADSSANAFFEAAKGSAALDVDLSVMAYQAAARLLDCAGRHKQAADLRSMVLDGVRGPVDDDNAMVGPYAMADLALGLGQARAAEGDDAAALVAFREAESRSARVDAPDLEAAILQGMAASLRRLGEEKKAAKVEGRLAKLGAVVEPRFSDSCLLPAVAATVVTPVFPPEHPRSWEAQVTVRCEVDTHGNPQSCSAVGGWGRVGAFEPAALAAVGAWTWFPALEHGKPVASQRTVDVSFVR